MNNMAQDNVLWLRQLPYYSVPVSEFENDFGFSVITKADFINNDFLNENLYFTINGSTTNSTIME